MAHRLPACLVVSLFLPPTKNTHTQSFALEQNTFCFLEGPWESTISKPPWMVNAPEGGREVLLQKAICRFGLFTVCVVLRHSVDGVPVSTREIMCATLKCFESYILSKLSPEPTKEKVTLFRKRMVFHHATPVKVERCGDGVFPLKNHSEIVVWAGAGKSWAWEGHRLPEGSAQWPWEPRMAGLGVGSGGRERVFAGPEL